MSSYAPAAPVVATPYTDVLPAPAGPVGGWHEDHEDLVEDVPSGDVELLERLRAGDEDLDGDDLAALNRWRECDVDELDVDADGDLELVAQLRERDWSGV